MPLLIRMSIQKAHRVRCTCSRNCHTWVDGYGQCVGCHVHVEIRSVLGSCMASIVACDQGIGPVVEFASLCFYLVSMTVLSSSCRVRCLISSSLVVSEMGGSVDCCTRSGGFQGYCCRRDIRMGTLDLSRVLVYMVPPMLGVGYVAFVAVGTEFEATLVKGLAIGQQCHAISDISRASISCSSCAGENRLGTCTLPPAQGVRSNSDCPRYFIVTYSKRVGDANDARLLGDTTSISSHGETFHPHPPLCCGHDSPTHTTLSTTSCRP